MSKHKHKTPAASTIESTTQDLTAASASTAAATKPESVLDEVFDTVTAWAAQGLDVAKRGLEASARWLDARARVVGELATKLASTSRAGTASAAPDAAQGTTAQSA